MTCCLIAVIVFLVLAVIGVVLGGVFGIILKKNEYKLNSEINTNVPWNADFTNKSSMAHQNLTEQINDALNKAFKTDHLNKYSSPKNEIKELKPSTSTSRRKKRTTPSTHCVIQTSYKSKNELSRSDFVTDMNAAQIGRASCRERV